jgi:hypothetical protein
LIRRSNRWHLIGTAVFEHERQPCRLDYEVLCDARWRTTSAKVQGWLGRHALDIETSVDETGRWSLNGTHVPETTGCIDVDLNFSPSTNLLPIRRLNLDVGQEADVSAAWLRFPSFRLERLDQRYRRLAERSYKYESAGGSFTAEIEVDDAGFVTRYGFWQAEAAV